MEADGGDEEGLSALEKQKNLFGTDQESSFSVLQQRPVATFEERFQQFYLQLAEGKTGGMVVSSNVHLLEACNVVTSRDFTARDMGSHPAQQC